MDVIAVFFMCMSATSAGVAIGVALTWRSAIKVASEIIEEAAQKAEVEASS